MVVMKHSIFSVEAAARHEGFTHGLIAFAKPFAGPDFFFVWGLLLALRDRPRLVHLCGS